MKTKHHWAWLLALTVLVTGCNKKQEKEKEETGKSKRNVKTPGKLSSRKVPEPKAPPETAEAAVTRVVEGIRNNELEALWDALPESYQNDVTALAKQFGEKMDEELWEDSIGIISQGIKVLKTKKDFILGHPQLAPMLQAQGVDTGKLSTEWTAVMGVLQDLFGTELDELDSMKEFDGRGLLGGPISATMKQLNASAQVLGGEKITMLEGVTVVTVSETDDTAVLKLTSPNPANPAAKIENQVDFVKVEGKWIPKWIADTWVKQVQTLNEQLEGITPNEITQIKIAVSPGLDTAEKLLTQLENAGTQREFNEAMALPMRGLLAAAQQFGKNRLPGLGSPEAASLFVVIFSEDLGKETADAFLEELLTQLGDAQGSPVTGDAIADPGFNTEIEVKGVQEFATFSKTVTALVEMKKLGKVTDVDDKTQEITVEVTSAEKEEEDKPETPAEVTPEGENLKTPTEKPMETKKD